jgi:dynein heavy chain
MVNDLKGFISYYQDGGVPALNFKEVRPFLADPDFTYEKILTKNSAAAGLCNWVVNIVIYYDVVVGVEPKRKALAEATQTLLEANQRLKEVKEKVAMLEARLAKLSAEFAAANKEKSEAEATVAKGTMKLDLAQRLIKALSSENVRWNKGVTILEDSKVRLIGDSLLSSAFISYIGPFTKEFRDVLVYERWLPIIQDDGVPISEPASPLKVLTNESEIAKWNTQGLPADPVSSENGAIVCRSSRWPLMIDPQLQGIAWVRSMEGGNPDRPLTVVRLENKDILYKLKEALENGLPFLIENMGEKIDATLMPVVQRATTKRGTKQYLKLGEDEVELHKDFQLYMHTKLSNPHYPPEIQAEATLVNFTVTPGGLEDQLLSLVVRKERPDLAAQKAALIQQQNQCMIKIKELEDEILGRLASAEGDITEDKELIEGLENAKKLSNDINKQLELGRKTSKQINMTSEKYRPTARRGSQLFFIMQQLSKVHTYYIYSLNAYVVVFSSAIDIVQAADKTKRGGAKGGANTLVGGGGEGGGKLRGLKRLKKFTENIIGQLRRFPWSHNILLQAAGDDGMDASLLQTFFTGVVEGPKGDIFSIGDTVDTSFGTGVILEEQEDPHLYLVELRDSKIHGQPMRLYMASGSVRKYIDYDERTKVLSDKITNVVFNYMRRGLFDRDKLLVTTLMFFTLQVADNRLEPTIVDNMLQNKLLEQADPENPEEVPSKVAEWMPDVVYRRALQVAADMAKIVPDMSTLKGQLTGPDSDKWKAWYAESKPEEMPMPAPLASLARQYRLPLLRALRPDRVTFALTEYLEATEGTDYVFQPPFDMAKTYRESSASTPIFFVLFPGVDPTPWVENLGKSFNISQEAGLFVNISMGQGQEAPAEAEIEKMAKVGGWIMLQNLHLMQSWLPSLERKLEVCATSAHKNFRCFCSAEPPSFAYMRNMPESLMQSCIKVSNEAPSDLKSNILRAWDAFDAERLKCVPEQMDNFKTCLFGLCFFHSVMLGRKKYGQQGWSRKYGFNTGDLTICGDVLESYVRNAKTFVPWDDLRYVFGEIMYGGHITDFWDRRVDNNYLSLIFQEDILCKQGELGPNFHTPDPNGLWYDDYKDTVMRTLPPESPPMYGLHENSEIAYLNTGTESIFGTILRLRAGSSSGGGSGTGLDEVITSLLDELPSKFDIITLDEKAKPLMDTDQQPYILVALQESGRMNVLLTEMLRSLEELQKGLAGALNMTNLMEELVLSLSINQVPGRNPFHKASWEKLAWFSMKSLSSWFPDMKLRCDSLRSWDETLKLPFSLWLPSLFNPTSFLTAIKQATARKEKLPLDNMSTETHCTTMLTAEEADRYPQDGAFVHGLFIEGARWQDLDEAASFASDVEGEKIAGMLVESRPRQLLTSMPLIYMKAVIVQKDWDPQAVGYIRPEKDIYNCPCYTTTFRGPTFVFVATLKTHERAEKWISAGVALMFQTDD